MFLGILGGMIACVYGGYSSMSAFIEGIQTDFIPFHMTYAFIKSVVFAFILATVPSFHGYYMKGGALEVGKASGETYYEHDANKPAGASSDVINYQCGSQ